MDDFIEKLVKPDLYKKELEKKMREADADFIRAQEKIKKAQDELANNKDFTEVAMKYSEAESAKNGGDLGWFTSDQMIPEIAFSVFLIKKGDRSDVIESPLGFHIVHVEDRKTEDGVDKVKVKQILVKTKDFAGWLTEKEKSTNVYIPLKEYYWDKERAVVEFTDNEMKDFESNLDKNSAGDISTLF
jgi:parvulin-like peptidyl-prolyl isomerase